VLPSLTTSSPAEGPGTVEEAAGRGSGASKLTLFSPTLLGLFPHPAHCSGRDSKGWCPAPEPHSGSQKPSGAPFPPQDWQMPHGGALRRSLPKIRTPPAPPGLPHCLPSPSSRGKVGRRGLGCPGEPGPGVTGESSS
jgi:hypothetical protein